MSSVRLESRFEIPAVSTDSLTGAHAQTGMGTGVDAAAAYHVKCELVFRQRLSATDAGDPYGRAAEDDPRPKYAAPSYKLAFSAYGSAWRHAARARMADVTNA